MGWCIISERRPRRAPPTLLLACCVLVLAVNAAGSKDDSSAAAMHWLWGTPILASMDEKAARSNAPVAAYLRHGRYMDP